MLEIYLTCAHAEGWQSEMTTWLTGLLKGNITDLMSLYFGAVIMSKSLTNDHSKWGERPRPRS
jgi:hypothetical protein